MTLAPDGGDDPRGAVTQGETSDRDSLRPAVASRAAGGGLWLIGGGAALAGLMVFGVLASARNSDAARTLDLTAPSGAAAPATASPPPSDLALAETAARNPGYEVLPGPAFTPPPLQASLPSPPVYVAAAPRSFVQTTPQGPSAQQRRNAPTLIVDLGTGAGAGGVLLTAAATAQGGSAAGKPAGEAPGGSTSGGAASLAAAAGALGAGGQGLAAGPTSTLNGNEQFAERIGEDSVQQVGATMLRNPSAVVPQGAMIPGVLETALNSDLPGFARAVVSRDVRSFDGSQVLIPRGSRVIGQYRSGVALGQSRAFIIWTRVLRPDGASIQLASSGTDALGRAGLEGSVDRHFFQRFGGAILLSVLNAGVAALGETPSTQVTIGSTQQATGLAGGALAGTDIPPTIKVPQGSPIRIFVARDLDFSAVGGTGR